MSLNKHKTNWKHVHCLFIPLQRCLQRSDTCSWSLWQISFCHVQENTKIFASTFEANQANHFTFLNHLYSKFIHCITKVLFCMKFLSCCGGSFLTLWKHGFFWEPNGKKICLCWCCDAQTPVYISRLCYLALIGTLTNFNFMECLEVSILKNGIKRASQV